MSSNCKCKYKRYFEFLADREQDIANVILPTKIVQENILGGLEGMLDAAMAEHEKQRGSEND